jgi:hypothetical protein
MVVLDISESSATFGPAETLRAIMGAITPSMMAPLAAARAPIVR